MIDKGGSPTRRKQPTPGFAWPPRFAFCSPVRHGACNRGHAKVWARAPEIDNDNSP